MPKRRMRSLLILGGLLLFAAALWLWSPGGAPASGQKDPAESRKTDSAADPRTPQPAEETTDPARPPAVPPAREKADPDRADTDSQSHRAVVRSRTITLEPDLESLIREFEAGRTDGFRLDTFDGESAWVDVRGIRENGLGAKTVIGKVHGDPGSTVTLARVDQATAGTIRIPSRKRIYEIRQPAGEQMRLREVDVHALGKCRICLKAKSATSSPPANPSPNPLPAP